MTLHDLDTRCVWLRPLACLLLLAGLVFCGQSVWIDGKAWLSQRLLAHAWQRSLDTGWSHRAWPWADTVPVARLTVPSLHRSFVVLDGASGEAMAFGPSLVSRNIHRADQETLAIGGHRDTHLAFLAELPVGEEVTLQLPDGTWRSYRLDSTHIVDSRTHTLALNTTTPGLVLITCYPFNALQTGGPLRYVATASRVL